MDNIIAYKIVQKILPTSKSTCKYPKNLFDFPSKIFLADMYFFKCTKISYISTIVPTPLLLDRLQRVSFYYLTGTKFNSTAHNTNASFVYNIIIKKKYFKNIIIILSIKTFINCFCLPVFFLIYERFNTILKILNNVYCAGGYL